MQSPHTVQEDPEIRDVPLMIWVIPSFGIIIPNLTGLFGDLTAGAITYWFGYLFFIFTAYTIWLGNRTLYLQQRKYFDWFSKPIMKIITVLFSNIFYTAPVTVLLCLLWYEISGLPLDWESIESATLFTVIAVIFITHVYETAFLIKYREDDMVRVANLERSRALAELEALKNQLDPHFMFNSLNTLSYLIENDRTTAQKFIDHLADVYRYILQNKKRELVQLTEEIEFLNHYFTLLQLRFGNSIHLVWDSRALSDELFIPPISLQVLLENAVKHNDFDEEHPLKIDIRLRDDHISFRNSKRGKENERSSLNIGLDNLNERFKMITDQSISVSDRDRFFEVHLPIRTIKM